MKTALILASCFSVATAQICFAQSGNMQEYQDGVPTAPFRIEHTNEIRAPKDQRPVIFSLPESCPSKVHTASPQRYRNRIDESEVARFAQIESNLSPKNSLRLDQFKKAVRMEIEDRIDRLSTIRFRGQKCKVRFWVNRTGKISRIDVAETKNSLFSSFVIALIAKMEGAKVLNIPKEISIDNVLVSFVLRTNPLYIVAPEKSAKLSRHSANPTRK